MSRDHYRGPARCDNCLGDDDLSVTCAQCLQDAEDFDEMLRGIRQTCLTLGLLGLYLHLALAVELADECHAYVPDYYRDKWGLTERLAALRGEP